MRPPPRRAIAPLLGALLALAAWPDQARAIQPLEAFLDSARARGLDRREQEALLSQREAEADAARRSFLPVITARGATTHNQWLQEVTLPDANGQKTTAVLTPIRQYDASFTAETQLLDLSRWAHLRGQEARTGAARARLASTTLDLERQVTRAYFDVLTTRPAEAAAGRTVEAQQAHLDVIRQRRAAGSATELDGLRLVAAVEGARQSLAVAARDRALAERRLASLSGLAAEAGGELPADDLHDEPPLESFRRGPSPSVVAAELEAVAQEHEAARARLALLPTLGTSAQERFTNATGFGHHQAIFQATLDLTWRFDAGAFSLARAQGAAEAAERVRAERSSQAHEDQLLADWLEARAQVAGLRAALAGEASARLADEVARVRFDAGALQPADLLQADRDAFAAEVTRLQAAGDLAFARAALRLTAAPAGAGGRP